MFSFLKKKRAPIETEMLTDLEAIPNHVAIIMDGNGRWAKKRLMPRVAGHKEGMQTVKKITKHASRIGVKVLTLYAFSTENWKRPTDEVNFLMQLPVDFFDTFVPELIAENVKVQVIGDIEQLPAHTQKAVKDAMAKTKQNTGMILNFALNYGSRLEILNAVKGISQEIEQGDLHADEIDEAVFEQHLMTHILGDYQEPDLLIRTSGEQRISNFLLWQIAYSEFVFLDILWPDFDEQTLEEAITIYQSRNRRFGGITAK